MSYQLIKCDLPPTHVKVRQEQIDGDNNQLFNSVQAFTLLRGRNSRAKSVAPYE